MCTLNTCRPTLVRTCRADTHKHTHEVRFQHRTPAWSGYCPNPSTLKVVKGTLSLGTERHACHHVSATRVCGRRNHITCTLPTLAQFLPEKSKDPVQVQPHPAQQAAKNLHLPAGRVPARRHHHLLRAPAPVEEPRCPAVPCPPSLAASGTPFPFIIRMAPTFPFQTLA